jgi:hypothetical protein
MGRQAETVLLPLGWSYEGTAMRSLPQLDVAGDSMLVQREPVLSIFPLFLTISHKDEKEPYSSNSQALVDNNLF